jgi:hypothetical protein
MVALEVYGIDVVAMTDSVICIEKMHNGTHTHLTFRLVSNSL